jgi:hypothetical protein
MTQATLASQGRQRGRRPLRLIELTDRRPEMNIDKDQILQLLRSQGKDDQASQASSELPDKVDTDNAQHAGMLSKYGIDPGNITDKLGGLGKLL